MKTIINALCAAIIFGAVTGFIDFMIEKNGPWMGLSTGFGILTLVIIHRTKP